MKVAAIQMVSGGSVDDNLRQAAQLLIEAARQGARMAVLPENFAVFDSTQLSDVGSNERSPEGPIRRFLAEQARTLEIYIVAGSLPCGARPDNTELRHRTRASCFAYSPQGCEIGRYDKIHLFDVLVGDAHGQYQESAVIEPGECLSTIVVDDQTVGLSICYDLRFPAMYTRLALAGASVICVPAAFTYHTGEAHWETLLRARAIENQVYVIAPNQGGEHAATRRTWGHTMIIDPWGRVMGCLEEGAGVLVVDLDLSQPSRLRQKMPVMAHRRDVDALQ
ncbi:MAG: carbon-nitrogen hydrolase family protein [Hahellaceae bacterium]|nr:carbon-nitrogen hydrolase family protein [Hahellaceae bacterium]MCP5169029.1 carbon-nitrogen hydrolase family protein [Hahellaceae bacterium]